mmetsp:Transcript_46350/g.98296  ORF Transcript_46350/g.98296 Transcript_46350/m.98296 type:complete len:382 (-) Transcript_46350:842-1987(-)
MTVVPGQNRTGGGRDSNASMKVAFNPSGLFATALCSRSCDLANTNAPDTSSPAFGCFKAMSSLVMASFTMSSDDFPSGDDLRSSLSRKSARALHATPSAHDAGLAVGTSRVPALPTQTPVTPFFFFPPALLGDSPAPPPPFSLSPLSLLSSPWYEARSDARSMPRASKHTAVFPILAKSSARLNSATRACCGVAPARATVEADRVEVPPSPFSLPPFLLPPLPKLPALSSDTDRDDVVGTRLITSKTLSFPSLSIAKLLDAAATRLACPAPLSPLDLAALVTRVRYPLRASVSFSSPPSSSLARARLARMGPASRSASCCCCACFFPNASSSLAVAPSDPPPSSSSAEGSRMVNAEASACSSSLFASKMEELSRASKDTRR